MPALSNQAAEALLRDLVAIPSPSRQEARASDFLVCWMRQAGFDQAFVDEAGNAVGRIGSGAREILLLGHIDTVGGFPRVHQAGRKLYGRGTVDAKGPLCAFAAAASRANIAPDLRVTVIGAVEEEAATSKGARYALSRYRPDYCIIGEPSRWDRITLGYKGRLLLDWRWEGGMTHSAADAPSPAERAVDFWLRARRCADDFNHETNSLFTRLDASLRDIKTYQKGADAVAEMTIGFRLPPGFDAAALSERLAPEAGATVTARGAEAAFSADKNSELSRRFRRAIRARGGRPRFVRKTGTSDMNVVGPAWDCPIAAYGPGDSALDHTPDEHVDLDEYLLAIDVLTDLLSAL